MLRKAHISLLKDHWKTIDQSNCEDLNNITDEIHRLAQFPAMLGKRYFEHKDDDSQTNMHWIDGRGFVGKKSEANPHIQMSFLPSAFQLSLWVSDRGQAFIFDVLNKSKADLTSEIKAALRTIGSYEAELFNLNLHYDIPEHHTDRGGRYFEHYNDSQLQEVLNFERIRSNAHLAILEVVKQFTDCTEVATWPHHFDVGSYLVLERDEQGQMTKTISIGMAIHDGVHEEHYFYVNPWRREGEFKAETFPELANGKWCTSGNWTGAILPISSLQGDADSQVATLATYFNKALSQALETIEAEAPAWTTA
ncbi:MAG: hypothetical protein MRZ79_26065 [Bacteroidia bacterium]|nr:hypothetical protein [Bacteroidia bacterium]